MNEQDRSGAISLAERELSAFILSIQRVRGSGVAEVAGSYWIEALERLDAAVDPQFDWRKITIAAASRLASETISHDACRTKEIVSGQLNP
jgi:hypothetical protein